MQRLLYFLVYPILWLISLLPFWLLYLKSTLLFYVVYYVIGYRKKVVLSNLALVFPDKTTSERRAIAKGFYRHLCDLIFETIKGITISEATLRKRYVIENAEIFDAYHAEGRSLLVCCAHYANWEWSSLVPVMTKLKGFGVYKPLVNPYFDSLVKNIRGKFGATIVSNKKAVTTLFKMSKQQIPSITLLVADQTPKLGAFKLRDTFMGVDVPVFTGPEDLAKRLDFNIGYLKTQKVKRGYYRVTLIPLSETPQQTAPFEITRLFLDEIEKQIHAAPQYYLWSHKRWKHRKTD